jgi:outer membrane receptor protein involved in Fe transport
MISLAHRSLCGVNYAVIKPALAALLGVVSLCLPFTAHADAITRGELEETGQFETGAALTLQRPDLFSSVDGATLIHGLPVLTLLDGRRFPISSELGRMGMTPFDVFPVASLSAVEVQKVNGSLRYGSDSPGGVVNLRTNRMYTGGEVGFLYGRSNGKYGREDYSAYMIGGIGNEKFNITVGVSHSESEVRAPRGRRYRD